MQNDLIIEDRRPTYSVKFKDISFGRFFECDGVIYQKIEDYEVGRKIFNKAVCLKSGVAYCFNEDVETTPLNIRIIIE